MGLGDGRDAGIGGTEPVSSAVPASAEIQTLVALEVSRQVGALRSEWAAELERSLAELRDRLPQDRVSLVVFSGDLDRVLAAFVLATGAAAAGFETTIFFTFWGLSVVKRKEPCPLDKDFKQRILGLLTPAGSEALGTSKWNFFGLGARMLRSMMADQGIVSLEELMVTARELGVRMMACTMSMDAMGLQKAELLDGLDYGGVSAFVAVASRSRITLFI